MALLLLFVIFFNAHGAGTTDSTWLGGSDTRTFSAWLIPNQLTAAETGDSDNDVQQAIPDNDVQQAIEGCRAEIQKRLDPEFYLTITVLREFVDFVEPIRTILRDLLQNNQKDLSKSMLRPISIGGKIMVRDLSWNTEKDWPDSNRFYHRDSFVDLPLYHAALNSLISYLPANQEGPLWVKKEEELSKNSRVFTQGFQLLISSLHAYCRKEIASAQATYDRFSDMLIPNNIFWELAQTSIDPYRVEIKAILTSEDYSSIQHSDDFIALTTPLVKVLENATEHSRDYLCTASFPEDRFETAVLHFLDPPIFLQAFSRLQHLAHHDTAKNNQKLRQASPYLCATLLDFCCDNRAGASKSYNAFLKAI
ncbi:MAG: hypothetical protein OXC30_01400 [Alphaproteobacteria bacterium]|nr:hypothetical protein [Alphaproteobacteria bacterium]